MASHAQHSVPPRQCCAPFHSSAKWSVTPHPIYTPPLRKQTRKITDWSRRRRLPIRAHFTRAHGLAVFVTVKVRHDQQVPFLARQLDKDALFARRVFWDAGAVRGSVTSQVGSSVHASEMITMTSNCPVAHCRRCHVENHGVISDTLCLLLVRLTEAESQNRLMPKRKCCHRDAQGLRHVPALCTRHRREARAPRARPAP